MEYVYTGTKDEGINKYEEALKILGLTLFDVDFVRKSNAVIYTLGAQEIDFSKINKPENHTDEFDFSKPYEIHTEDISKITEFRYNIDENGYISYEGEDARTPFYQYISKMRTLGITADKPEGNKANITELSSRSK